MKGKLALLSLFILASGCGKSDDKNKSDSQLQEISPVGGEVYSSLPLSGSVNENLNFWSGDHWPINKSSINYRWQTGDMNSLSYHSPSLEELTVMTEDEIALLSPSEKYDIFMGRYNYPLRSEVQQRINLVAMAWEGVGDGWAAATSFHGEPAPINVTNGDNISIHFGSSDIKALMSYYYSFSHNSAASQVGVRCNSAQGQASEDPNCNNDLTAAQFHVALAKTVGNEKRTIIMDLDRFEQVWNHPITSYESSVVKELAPEEDAPKGTVNTLAMRTKVSYLDRSYNHAWNPVKGTWNQVKTNRVYSYQLHLNSKGEMIGSNWVSHDRPDFLWIPQKASGFGGSLSGLSRLYKPVEQITTQPEVVPPTPEPETEPVSETETAE